jgi:hypothetical protein
MSLLPVIHENIPLLEVADAVTLDQLLADVAVADAIVQRLAPTVAVIDPAKVEALSARLLKLGHLPGTVAQ